VGGTDKPALFRVAQIDPVRVVVQVPEADAGLVTPGQNVSFAVQGLEGPPPVGKVRRTSWSLEPGSRSLWAAIDLPKPKGVVRPGMYVYAKLTAELPAAWAVPTGAVAKIGDESVMYLVENGKAVRVVVQPLRGDGKFTQLKGYKKPGAADWSEFTGAESVASPAAAVTDGQTVGCVIDSNTATTSGGGIYTAGPSCPARADHIHREKRVQTPRRQTT